MQDVITRGGPKYCYRKVSYEVIKPSYEDSTTDEAEARMVDQEMNERNHPYIDHVFAHKTH